MVTPLSRTVGETARRRRADHQLHPRLRDAGIAAGRRADGRKVTIPFVVVVGFDGDKISYEHIYWDQASMLVQIGLLDKTALPVTGAEQTARLLDPSLPSNTLIPKGKATQR